MNEWGVCPCQYVVYQEGGIPIVALKTMLVQKVLC